MTQDQVTTETVRFATLIHSTTPERKLVCPECSAECSANPADYFRMPADMRFTCDHGDPDGDACPMELQERRGITGNDEQDRPFWGVVYVTIAEEAMRADLDH